MRLCGPCHACCVHLSIEDFQKVAHLPCQHLRSTGCRIYKRRPVTCREFLCLWRLGVLPESKRPDLCGVLVHAARNDIGGVGVNVVECESGALDREVHVVDALKTLDCVLLTRRYRDGRSRLYSKDTRWIEDLRCRNPVLNLPEGLASIEIEAID